MESRYKNSEELLARALKTIPLGSQTFSKSKTQFPHGVSPFFINRGLGSRVWDVDGNEYVDFMNSLCAVTLGYGDPDVTKAVREQLELGTIFSLPHPVEVKVAEKIVEMVPCAEMVRFGKNGSDATSGAVRIARAFTGRDHIATCGYHGWQDWYIGSTARNKGVPASIRGLTHTFQYNNLDSLRKIFSEHPNEVALVIMEPMNVEEPKAGFLEGVAEMARQHGSVFALDETITGFRFANGGAQAYFDITPDLATFGKGLANGYPVSAIAGRAEIMRLMEEIFFSFTFGGEALSLAASLATMLKLQREPVVATMNAIGFSIMEGSRERIKRHGCSDFLAVAGHPTWSFMVFTDAKGCSLWEIKTLFMQEVLARGILSIGTHNISYSHRQAEVDKLMCVYDEVLPLLSDAVKKGEVQTKLHCTPLVPLFKVR